MSDSELELEAWRVMAEHGHISAVALAKHAEVVAAWKHAMAPRRKRKPGYFVSAQD
jgi:hypothetical protein